MKLFYYGALVATGTQAAYKVSMRLCTDKVGKDGMAKEALGKAKSFFISLDSDAPQVIDIPYNKRGSKLMTTTLPGDLGGIQTVNLKYEGYDILCIEELILEQDGTKYNIIQVKYYEILELDFSQGNIFLKSSTQNLNFESSCPKLKILY